MTLIKKNLDVSLISLQPLVFKIILRAMGAPLMLFISVAIGVVLFNPDDSLLH